MGSVPVFCDCEYNSQTLNKNGRLFRNVPKSQMCMNLLKVDDTFHNLLHESYRLGLPYNEFGYYEEIFFLRTITCCQRLHS